jgi:outer membrane protein
VLTVLVACAVFVLAPAAMAELNIAVVDVNEAVSQTQEAREFLSRVQEELQPDQERIRELTAEKSRIEERVERDGEVLSDAERLSLSEEYDRITSDLQYRAETYQKALQRRRNELLRQMGPRVQAALDDLVALEGYDLVVPVGAVIYANPQHDITVKLTERLDEKG